jgi:nicotinamide-nucleotide amidase
MQTNGFATPRGASSGDEGVEMTAMPHASDAERLLQILRQRGLMLASAESCTGGMIAAALTDIAGSSDVFERGFVTYSNAAKIELLNVPSTVLAEVGAVSAEVAILMAEGAVHNSHAHLAVAVTGVAGPAGGSPEKPVGLVHLAASWGEGATLHEECRFGALTRHEIRALTVTAAFRLVERLLTQVPSTHPGERDAGPSHAPT